MPWIKVYSLDEATGFLKKQNEAALKRAGRIWHVVSIMSQNPRALKTSMDFSALSLAIQSSGMPHTDWWLKEWR